MAVDKGNDHEKYRGLGGGREGHGVLSSPLKDVGVRAGDWATDLIPYNLNLQKKKIFFKVYEFHFMHSLSFCADEEHERFGYGSLLS